MQSQHQILEHITQCLERAGIAYMLSGSVALSYYAQPRMTRDIDLVIEIQSSDLSRLACQLDDVYYFDEDAAHAAITQEGMFNLLHQESMIKIDCIVRKHHAYRQKEFSRRRRVAFNHTVIWMVSAEDLLLSKLDWLKDTRSEIQLKDVSNLIASAPDLDWDYLQHWAERLGVSRLLEEVRP